MASKENKNFLSLNLYDRLSTLFCSVSCEFISSLIPVFNVFPTTKAEQHFPFMDALLSVCYCTLLYCMYSCIPLPVRDGDLRYLRGLIKKDESQRLASTCSSFSVNDSCRMRSRNQVFPCPVLQSLTL